MKLFRRRSGKWWTVFEDRDGQLGWIGLADDGDGWEWSTDLRGLRMAQQLHGRSTSLLAAQQAFKDSYVKWRPQFTDDQFDETYRRSPKPDV